MRPPFSASAPQAEPRSLSGEHATQVVIPVRAEELEVARRVVDRGAVRVVKHVEERVEHFSVDPLWQENVDVQRVERGHFVDVAPSPYYDGDTLILSVVEEVLVVEKRLRVREELRVTRRWSQEPGPTGEMLLRKETIEVERSSPETGALRPLPTVPLERATAGEPTKD